MDGQNNNKNGAARRKLVLNRELKGIVQKLKAHYKPEKIILFGSLAKGNLKSWSDIDLTIIKKTSKKFVLRLKEAALLTRPKVGTNFLVYTPEEIKKMTLAGDNFFTSEILNKGKVLYDVTKKS